MASRHADRRVLIDTSAWVEFLRASGSPTHHRVREAISLGQVTVTDPVVLELLVGARPGQLVPLRRMMNSFDHAAVQPRDDWEHAAELYRHCRSRGVTIRSLHDCLIAAVAIRTRTPLLHADRDFDRLAELTDLEVA